MLNRLKNIFSKKENLQDFGLGVPDLPRTFYSSKSSFKSDDFKKLVTEHFAPKIHELGFKGKDYFYYRDNGVYTEILSFWTYRSGGAIQVDLLVKFNNITYPPDHLPIKTAKLKSEDCEFWKKLTPVDNFKAWFWMFGEETRTNISVIDDMWDIFIKHGIPHFDKFKNHEEYLRKFYPKELSNIQTLNETKEFMPRLLFGRGAVSIIYFFMKYWDQQNDKKTAREFATIGIAKNYDKWNGDYKTEFESCINNNS